MDIKVHSYFIARAIIDIDFLNYRKTANEAFPILISWFNGTAKSTREAFRKGSKAIHCELTTTPGSRFSCQNNKKLAKLHKFSP